MAAIRTIVPEAPKAEPTVAVEDLKPIAKDETADAKENITSETDKPSDK